MNNIYMQNILDHYHDPENYGTMDDATHKYIGHNPFCGDKITVYLKIEEDVVVDVKFEGEGCAISQAAMSILSEELIGKTVEEAKAITSEDIVEMLGIDLSPTRLKCALLGLESVQIVLS